MKSKHCCKTRRKRRNCYDRMRSKVLNARRSGRIDPSATVALQLLSIFFVIFGRVPILNPPPIPYSAPSRSTRSLQRHEAARHLGVPRRYMDVMASQGQVPYPLLFDHIKQGGVLRRDAIIEMRKRIPAPSLDWFDHIQKWGYWSDLLRCQSPNGFDQDTDVKLLKATLTWLDQSNRDNGGYGGPDGPT